MWIYPHIVLKYRTESDKVGADEPAEMGCLLIHVRVSGVLGRPGRPIGGRLC